MNLTIEQQDFLRRILLDRIYGNYELCNACPEIEVFDFVSIEHLALRELASSLDIEL